MPIYEYRCTACGRQFEVMQRITDRPLRKCEACSGKLQKLVSRTAFVLKGGGWYAEGYTREGGSKKSKKKAGETKAAGDSKKKSDAGAAA